MIQVAFEVPRYYVLYILCYGDRLRGLSHLVALASISHQFHAALTLSPPARARSDAAGYVGQTRVVGSYCRCFRRRQNAGSRGFSVFGPLLEGGRGPSQVGFLSTMAGSDG